MNGYNDNLKYVIIEMVRIMNNIIKIHLNNREDYVNGYNEKILSYDLSDYILEELKGIDTKEKIQFSITTDFEISDIEKDDLVAMIRNNFGADIGEIINLARKQRFVNYIISIISIILLVIYSVLEIELLSEFILIFAWVLLGEAICNFFYNSMENRYKIKRREHIVDA